MKDFSLLQCGLVASHKRRANALALCLTAGAATVMSTGSAAAATYTYTGNPFTLFSCGGNQDGISWSDCSTPGPNANTSYTATDKVTATLVLDNPLPANMAITDVRTLAGFHLSLSDGEQTVTEQVQQGMFAEVGTDAAGAITQWRLVINTGYPQNAGVSTTNKASSVADTGTMLGVYPGNNALNFSEPGTWSSSAPRPTPAIKNLINLLSNPMLVRQLTRAQITNLTNKLNTVLVLIQAGQYKQATSRLKAFISSVQLSQKAGNISQQSATTLIDAANNIINMLS